MYLCTKILELQQDMNDNFSLTLKEWADEDKPREKMLDKGKKELTNAELLAILLRSGLKGKTVVEVAKEVLTSSGNSLTTLSQMDFKQLSSIKGVGAAKATTLMAALELGWRMQGEINKDKELVISNSDDLFNYMKSTLVNLDHEEFWAVYLNASWYYLGCDRVTSGTGNSTTFDVRRVVKCAIDRGAFAVAVVHNHPSGNPKPSRADIVHTRELSDACTRFDLSLLDHVVVSDDSFYSFHEDLKYDR